MKPVKLDRNERHEWQQALHEQRKLTERAVLRGYAAGWKRAMRRGLLAGAVGGLVIGAGITAAFLV